MFQKLVSRNKDLEDLLLKGFAIAIDDKGYLVVRDIPYLDSSLALQWGAFVAELVFIDDVLIKQKDHQVFFAGAVPYGLDGKPVPGLAGGPTSPGQIGLSDASKDVVVERSFSAKPKPNEAYDDFFHKIETYVSLIAGPAMHKFKVHPYSRRAIQEIIPTDSVFRFHDTLTSLYGISDLSAKLANDVVAVIGAGGTGSYLIDFLAKTPVREIRIFDLDSFYVHNAFRAPGRLEKEELDKNKAEMYAARYENFRKGVVAKPKFVDADSSDDLSGVTFAFVSVDKGSSRSGIFDLLISLQIPFIDVGIGLNRKHDELDGMLRATYFPPHDAKRMCDLGLVELLDNPEDEYRRNVQIGELNALNAAFAVIRFKQLRGFFREEEAGNHLLMDIHDLRVKGL